MHGCGWCSEFEEELWPQIKKLEVINFKIIIGPDNPGLASKYGIKTYPSLVLLSSGKYKLFTGERTIENIKKFIG
tara:strand:- start:271 stop:495 length:225 start_codon:yes stop_codon:yes gene_type:complete